VKEQGEASNIQRTPHKLQLSMALIFEREAKANKEIIELEQEIQNIGFNLFSKHLLLSKCKKTIKIGENILLNPDTQLLKGEIQHIEERLKKLQQLKILKVKTIETISKQRKEALAKIEDSSQHSLKGWVNNIRAPTNGP
jgi:hypothetical protein